MSNAPFSWTPTNATPQGAAADVVGVPIPGGQVDAGDWVQVFVSYRDTNGGVPVTYTPDRFLIHVIYTPNSDDAMPHADQATTYGGAQSGVAGIGANRRRNYHIDTNYAFQVPFRGQISIVAGGVSNPRVTVDVLLVRGHTPRNSEERARMIHTAHEMQMVAAGSMDPMQFEAASFYAQLASSPPRIWAPPIVGVPGLVPATWVDIPMGTAIPFPDGAVKFETVFQNLGALVAPRLTINVMGNALGFDLPGSGLPVTVAAFTGGAATTLGTRPTWSSSQNLTYATIWSSLGG